MDKGINISDEILKMISYHELTIECRVILINPDIYTIFIMENVTTFKFTPDTKSLVFMGIPVKRCTDVKRIEVY